jgi:biopolymer transport protein ExbB
MFVALLSGAPQAAAAAGNSNGLMEAFKENPTFLSINLVVSAIVIAIVIERTAFQLGKYRVNSKEFFAQIKKLVTAGNIDRAIKLCDAGDYPILQLVKAGLTHANKGPDEIDAAMSEKMGELKPAAEKRIGSSASLERCSVSSTPSVPCPRPGCLRRTASASSRAVSRRPCTTRPSVSASP